MNFIDICSGIGGFRSGLEKAGFNCIGYVEIDEYVRKSYEEMYDTTGEWTATDIRTVESNEIPKADLWCFGFPCQDISIAGKHKGLTGERSGIFYNIISLLKNKDSKDRPEWLLVENVKNLLSIEGGEAFTEVLSEISETGYDTEWVLLNSKDFGVPQNRERVFIIGHLRERGRRKVLPLTGTDRQNCSKGSEIQTLIQGKYSQDIVLTEDSISRALMSRDYKGSQNVAIPESKRLKQIIPGAQANRVYDSNELSCALKSLSGGLGAKTGLYTVPEQNSQFGVFVYEGERYNIRRLTPRECFRLQGFTDEQFEKAEKVNSNTQLYKQAGNAVTVNIAEYLGNLIMETC